LYAHSLGAVVMMITKSVEYGPKLGVLNFLLSKRLVEQSSESNPGLLKLLLHDRHVETTTVVGRATGARLQVSRMSAADYHACSPGRVALGSDWRALALTTLCKARFVVDCFEGEQSTQFQVH